MLTGLFFLGVIAATAMPDVMSVLRGSAEDDTDGPDETVDEQAVDAMDGGGSLLDDTVSAVEAPDLDAAGEDADVDDVNIVDDADEAGVDLFVDPMVGTMVVEAFAPDVDTLTIVVPDSAQDFAVASDDGSGASSLSYSIEDGRVDLRFDGLPEVPIDDIFLRVSDASSPTQDADIGLGVVLKDTIVPPAPHESMVLFAEDPELTEDPATPIDEDLPVLAPEDPLIDEGPGDRPSVDGPVLEPVMDDIAPEPVEDTDALSPDPVDADVIAPSERTVGTEKYAIPNSAIRETDGPDSAVVAPEMADVAPLPTPAPSALSALVDETAAQTTGSTDDEWPTYSVFAVDADAAETGLLPASTDDVATAQRVADASPLDQAATDGLSQTIWLNPVDSVAGEDVTEVAGFRPGEDVLQISLDSSATMAGSVLDVTESPDGLDGVVRVDGVVVAILRGAPNAEPGDIVLETRPETFA